MDARASRNPRWWDTGGSWGSAACSAIRSRNEPGRGEIGSPIERSRPPLPLGFRLVALPLQLREEIFEAIGASRYFSMGRMGLTLWRPRGVVKGRGLE